MGVQQVAVTSLGFRSSGIFRSARPLRWVVIVLVVATIGPPGDPTAGAVDRKTGWLVLTSYRDGDSDIYLADSSTSRLTGVTRSAVSEAEPVLSSNGKKIAFERDYVIFAANADGTQLARIGKGFDHALSPDGRNVAYRGSNDTSTTGIWVEATDGSGRRTRLGSPDSWHPVWSPDGQSVAFQDDERNELVVRGLDGKPARALASSDGSSYCAWSPHGREIAFMREGGLYVVGVDGADERLVAARGRTEGFGGDIGEFSWSPQGEEIAFIRESGLYLVRSDATAERLVSRAEGYAWSPDGSSIAVAAQGELLIVGPEGTRRRWRPSVPRRFGLSSPSWSRDGSKIAFQSDDAVRVVAADGSAPARLVARTRVGIGGWTAPDAGPGRYPASPPPAAKALSSALLSLPAPVADLAADGGLVAVRSAGLGEAGCGRVVLWRPPTRQVIQLGEERMQCAPDSEPGGMYGLALANQRAMWAEYTQTNHTSLSLLVATAANPTPRALDGRGYDWDKTSAGSFAGDGALLAFLLGGKVALVERASRFHPVARRTGEATALAVDSGRLALLTKQRAVEVMSGTGRLLRHLPVPAGSRTLRLQGDDLVVLTRMGRNGWRLGAYQVLRSSRARALPLRKRVGTGGENACGDLSCSKPAALGLEDVHGGLAAYTLGQEIHLIRLADGREFSLSAPAGGPVHAQLEASGLFHSYNLPRGPQPGRVAFVPFETLRKLFNRNARPKP